MTMLPDVRTVTPAELEARCDEIARWVVEIADVWEARDVQANIEAAAAAYRKVTKRGQGAIAVVERLSEQRLGELIVVARERGELNTNGGASVEGSTLDDLGLDRHDAAEFVAMAQEPEAVAEALAESTDERPATRNKVRGKVKAKRRQQSSEHPATFSAAIIAAVVELLEVDPPTRILDPFAGTGLSHAIADKLGTDSVGVEIEPEWAQMHRRNICADSRAITRAMVGTFDAVTTSPTYGNRMADHHEARDESDRPTYRHRLGRPLTEGNAGALPWGDEYRALHVDVYRRVVELLAPSGRFILNVKDHVRDGARVPVSGWHVHTLLDLGLHYADDNALPTRGLGGAGDNAATREGVEHVYLLEKP